MPESKIAPIKQRSHLETKEKTHVPLEQAWCSFEALISRSYLDVLNLAIPLELDSSIDDALQQIQMHRVVRIVYDRKENNLAKFNSLFSALSLSDCSVFILLQNDSAATNLYIGVRGNDADSAADAREVLACSLKGNFPGAKSVPLQTTSDNDGVIDVAAVSENLRTNSCVAIVTGVPSLKKDTATSFSQGLEKIVDAMGDRPYAALFLATPVSRDQLADVERGYQKLCSDLSAFNVGQVSLSKQESISIGQSVSEGLSISLSKSVSLASSSSVSMSESKGKGSARNYGGAVASAGAIIGGAVGSVIPGAGTLIGAAVGGAVGGVIGGLVGSTTTSENSSTTKTTTETETSTDGRTETQTKTQTVTETSTESRGSTIQFNLRDRKVVDALSILDEQLKRIREAKSYGAWNWGAYFLAPCIESVEIGAQVYSGILRGEQTGVEHCAISYWVDADENSDKFRKVINSIAQFRHPCFDIGCGGVSVVVSPTALINTSELAVGMALPQKSLPGLPVFESVEFGRSVTTYDDQSTKLPLEIGAVSHLGSEDKLRVTLDGNSLTAHMFVTGSTGAGKSNFIYNLIQKLCVESNRKVKFLVVEPAKGEYKDKFAGLSDVEVYGTNPRKFTKILRLNPFWFPDGIHIMEHIDRLVEILNAAWPMYAAMPAILKDAVEISYQREGWDLLRSSCRGGARRFPDFHDLLEVLPEVIGKSDYDTEVKNNYTGSLVTRVKSLTQGYYRTIFQKEELNEDDLFGKSCIVDISRVGSMETKSLLMGVVFMKLLEYRMTEGVKPNSKLRHITVLEEAHNLLRKTSMAQGMETANLAGKSVEMMTNAIAEMRTYGEGFVIADQAPGLLDEAVIRNTNTKVVFRLPDMDDRILVGKAENLNDEQIGELARLKTGCASVYQNNWQEAVLCQTELFSSIPNGQYDPHENHENYIDGRHRADEIFIRVLLGRISHNVDLRSLPECDRQRLDAYYADSKIVADESLSDNELLDELYVRFVRRALQKTKPIKDRPSWTRELIKYIFSDDVIVSLESHLKDIMLENVFKVLARYDTHIEQRAIWDAESADLQKWRLW